MLCGILSCNQPHNMLYCCQTVNRLSPQKQEILHLRYDEQMKAKDIAEVVGLSYGNVRRILSETIAFLSKELEAYK